MLPDFYIIGAMKCGTTTLQSQLAALPAVFMCEPKEPNFFSDPGIWKKGMGWYEGLFAGATPSQLVGEASTHYTKWPDLPDAPARVAEATPDAKLIYCVRDPLARALSHYRHEWTQGVAPDGPETAARTMPALWQYGLYEKQLSRWLEHFDEDRVLIVSLERLNADPDTEFARVLAFLGLEGAWAHDRESANRADQRIKRYPLHGLIFANPVATAIRRVLVPQALRTRIAEKRRPKPVRFSGEALDYLTEQLADDTKAFGERFGMSLTVAGWKETVMGAQFDRIDAKEEADRARA